jgi:succinate dehydrogenase / fumarate reductase cytochrome b subunit
MPESARQPDLAGPAASPLGRGRESGLWPWLVQRITAVLLIYALAVHLVVTHIFNLGDISFANIDQRLESWFYIVTDFILLGASLVHGLNGLRMVLLDRWFRGVSRYALDFVLVVLGVATFAYGAWGLWAWLG